MNKLKFIFLTISTLTFINCSSDDERRTADCFECNLDGIATEFCKFGNGNTYTVAVVGGPDQEYTLEEDQTWEEFKDEMIYFYCEE